MVWTSSYTTYRNRDAAWGDVNGNGRLDVAFSAYYSGDDILYLNSDDGLEDFPTWRTNLPFRSFGVALGDLDNNGYPDLVHANFGFDSGDLGEPNTIYYNDGTGFSADPGWQSADSLKSRRVVLGDVDLDGDLDIFFSSNYGPKQLYLNNGGTFPTTPDWESEVFEDTRGMALGDINGDGYLDLVCANAYSEPERGILHAGAKVARAGDVNGDGFDDFLVGSDYQTTSRAWLYFGAPSVDSIGLLTLVAENPDDAFGYALNGIGDFDGDGFDDFAISAPFDTTTVPGWGRVDVFFGNAAPDTIADLVIGGSDPDREWLGTSIAGAGDLNGDGFGDLAVAGALNEDPDGWVGTVYVFFGGTNPDGIADLLINPPQDTYYYDFRIAAGDVNGDGFDDLAVCATNDTGRCYVFFGGADPDTTADLVLSGENDLDSFGHSVASAGDINGDGFDDLLVGAVGNDAGGVNAGRSYVYFGGVDPDTVADLVMTGERPTDLFGKSVSGSVDLNGDGFDDFVVGADLYDASGYSNGRAYVYFGGADPDTVADLVMDGDPYFYFGRAVCGAGDVNGDGYGDLVVGAPGADNRLWASNAGQTSLFLGAATPDSIADGHWVPELESPSPNSVYLNQGDGTFPTTPSWRSERKQFSYTVALGDVDGNGSLDAVFGSLIGDDLYTYGGHLTLYLNTGDSLSAAPAWVSADSARTRGVALGDMDGDGDLDLVTAKANGYNDVFLNQSGSYSPVPDLEFGDPQESCWAIALGDVDGDGDLDVCLPGNGTARVYENKLETLAFSPSPTWISQESVTSLGVDVGDVNGDGFPDLVFANVGPNSVYYGSASGLVDSPGWVSGLSDTTHVVTFADVDGDSFLDLVCANSTRDALYTDVFQGGVGTASWVDPVSRNTIAMDLADMNGDGEGDTDRVIWVAPSAAGEQGELFIYLDSGSGFGPFHYWSQQGIWNTRAIVARDMDKDGDNDIVVANYGASSVGRNQFWENRGNDPWKPWPIGDSANDLSTCVALGDVNGDGSIDVAFGNDDAPTNLYYNSGVPADFASAPTWTSVSTDSSGSTSGIVLQDVDGDGDLDLITGRLGTLGPPHVVYFNDSSGLSSAPGWASVGADDVRGIAAADLDGDGDLDLASANDGVNTVRSGLRNPLFAGDPLSPTNHVPSNPAAIRHVAVTPASINHYKVSLTAQDVESDPVWVYPEYKLRQNSDWEPMLSGGLPMRVGPLATSPTGESGEFIMDVADFPMDALADFRFRWIESPMRVGLNRFSGFYFYAFGHVEVVRAVAEVSPSPVVFPAVTVGDSATVDLIVSNTGNAPLRILVAYATEGLRIEVSPRQILPDTSRTLPVHLEPVEVPSTTSEITLETDDPLNAIIVVPVVANVLDLIVDVGDLTVEEQAPLGKPLAILVSARDPDLRIESATLYYRPAFQPGSPDSSFTSIPFTRISNTFQGTMRFLASIPAEDVSDPAMEYYVQVQNGAAVRVYPPGAPEAGVFAKPVAPPEGLSVVAEENAEGEYDILIELPTGTRFASGALYFRRGGEAGYLEQPIHDGDPLPYGTIPGSLVGNRGLEYWVEVTTPSGTVLYEPPEFAASLDAAPLTIQTKVEDFEEETVHPGKRYRMLSIPVDFGSQFDKPLTALLSDDPEFGLPEPRRWRAFRWLAEDSTYCELSEECQDEFIPRPGRAFWLISKSDHQVNTDPVPGISTPTHRDYVIVLHPGWNQIGNPFAFPVAWDSSRVDGAPVVQARVEDPVAWNPNLGSEGNYEEGHTVLDPFSGYWVWSGEADSVNLAIPPREALVDSAVSPLHEAASSGEDWRIPITASASGARDGMNAGGVSPQSSTGYDARDRMDPPTPPGGGISVYFPHGERDEGAGLYTVDVREPLMPGAGEREGHAWSLDVAYTVQRDDRERILLEFNLAALPSDLEAVLLDRVLSRSVNLRDEPEYAFYSGPRPTVHRADDTRFELLVGSPAFIRSRQGEDTPAFSNRIFQNYPNPFGSNTLLRYEIKEKGPVRISVFDIQGRLIRALPQGEQAPGRYEVIWDGRDRLGRSQSPGVYFFRLETPGFTKSRRMVRIR